MQERNASESQSGETSEKKGEPSVSSYPAILSTPLSWILAREVVIPRLVTAPLAGADRCDEAEKQSYETAPLYEQILIQSLDLMKCREDLVLFLGDLKIAISSDSPLVAANFPSFFFSRTYKIQLVPTTTKIRRWFKLIEFRKETIV